MTERPERPREPAEEREEDGPRRPGDPFWPDEDNGEEPWEDGVRLGFPFSPGPRREKR